MKKICTVDPVDGISHIADLGSKLEDEEHTNFDHDLILEGESFDSLKSSIKTLDQD